MQFKTPQPPRAGFSGFCTIDNYFCSSLFPRINLMNARRFVLIWFFIVLLCTGSPSTRMGVNHSIITKTSRDGNMIHVPQIHLIESKQRMLKLKHLKRSVGEDLTWIEPLNRQPWWSTEGKWKSPSKITGNRREREVKTQFSGIIRETEKSFLPSQYLNCEILAFQLGKQGRGRCD